jgi:UDP-N-acetylmuramyl pentapeptide phosphotransferase/UDP-N-acetylglucosamine-1-phosphate transferase
MIAGFETSFPIIVAVSILPGTIGACAVALLGAKLGLIDSPNQRSSHKKKTPKGGGIGILAAFFLLSFLLDIPVMVWIPVLSVSLISFLFGDIMEISAKKRLLLQFIAAFMLLKSIDLGRYFENLQIIFPAIPVNMWLIVCSIFFAIYIVGSANFFNFMDGINGIAGVTGIIAFFLLAFISFKNQDTISFFLPLGIGLSCLGFLPFNFPKAFIFMGDVGSVLLGFLFACLVVMLSRTLTDFICYAGFLFPFYADELITMFERIKNGQALTEAHRCHLYQVLVNEKHIAHWKVTAGYGIVQLIISLILVGIKPLGILAVLLVLLGSFFLFFILNHWIKKNQSFGKRLFKKRI